MATSGPARSEGNLTASPRQQGACQGAPLALSRGADPSSCPQSCRGPSAQGNEPPAQDYGTLAQGNGPHRSLGQDCPSALGNGLPSGQGYGRPCAQGVGPLPHQGKSGVCNPNNENSETSKQDKASNLDSVENEDSVTNDQIYSFGSITIVLNTLLCFVATKKAWARMIICEQLKKHYNPEEIAQAHNIVIELSDARQPRLTTRDTKRMTNVIVHTLLDSLLDNGNIIFATTTTDVPPTDWDPPAKKQGVSSPFTKFFTKTKHETTQTHAAPTNSVPIDPLNVLNNKVDLMMEMFMKHQTALDKLFGNEDGLLWRSTSRKSGRSDELNSSCSSIPPYQIPTHNAIPADTSSNEPFLLCTPTTPFDSPILPSQPPTLPKPASASPASPAPPAPAHENSVKPPPFQVQTTTTTQQTTLLPRDTATQTYADKAREIANPVNASQRIPPHPTSPQAPTSIPPPPSASQHIPPPPPTPSSIPPPASTNQRIPSPPQHPPSNPPPPSATEKNIDKETQVTPSRSYIRNNNRRSMRKNRKENKKETNLPQPLAPNREWDDATHQHIPGVPPPLPHNTDVTPVVINNHNHIMPRQGTSNPPLLTNNETNDGFTLVRSRNKKKENNREQSCNAKPLQGAPKPEVLYLYITNCHTSTDEEDIENHLLINFPEVDSVSAFKTKMSHSYYASFTVSVKGKGLISDEFLKSDSFPSPVKVFLNRNKYKTSQSDQQQV